MSALTRSGAKAVFKSSAKRRQTRFVRSMFSRSEMPVSGRSASEYQSREKLSKL